ncbi:MAG: heme o synthase [Chloroflexi bacterium]|nr:heme o synthase [Chloroflexota bacterium]MBP8056086.1 heme o synthase [Chloroflexota bacterium]
MSEMEISESPQPLTMRIDWRQWVQSLVVLFKLRVVSLLLLAAVGGAFLGARGWPGLGTLLLVVVTGGMSAAGASALNQYLERHQDMKMSRTRSRPLVTGLIARPHTVLIVGLTLIALPTLAVLPFNPALSFYLALGALIYVGVYTIWLKPRTLLNIVIGGGAGSAAVMCGGAAAHAPNDVAVIILALLVFLWTPTHFWSLALLYRQDYQKASFPMLPAQVTPRQSALWVMVHTVPTGMATIGLILTPGLGWLYGLLATGLTIELLYRNIRLIAAPTPKHARRLFMSSNYYLMAVLLLICLDVII